MQVVLLNPGQMGERVGFAAWAGATVVRWVSEGRGPATRERAERAGLVDSGSLQEALAVADVVLSVVPPASALATARSVAAFGFRGLYADLNAVSPMTAADVADAVTAAGAAYVDGGIIGPPPRERGDARLYLAGSRAADVQSLFGGSVMDARVLDSSHNSTSASALKMAYAGWTKASSALLMNVRALARACQVEGALLDEWDISQPGVRNRSDQAATGNAHKAWRFIGEMEEIAATMTASGLTPGFHTGAAELYSSLERFKDDFDADPAEIYAAIASDDA
ncbi:MAG: DUF1932 domain-containing protein [Pseudomonadota bacterium]